MINICFWCRRSKDGEEGSPMYNDYSFCPDCQRLVDNGVAIIQVTSVPNDNPPVRDDIYPTGLWAVVPPEQIEPHTGTVFMDIETWKSYGLPE
jgi:hypothetical protein